MLISDAPWVIISILIPSFASALNIFPAVPGVVLIPSPTRLRIILWTETERMEFISGQWQESLEEGTVVSLLPLFGGAKGITTTGLTFPLHGESLEPGGIPCGVSNKVNLSPVKIDVSEGKLLLVVNHHFTE